MSIDIYREVYIQRKMKDGFSRERATEILNTVLTGSTPELFRRQPAPEIESDGSSLAYRPAERST